MARLDALQTVAGQHADTELIDLGSFQPYVSGGVAAADLVIASEASAVLAYNDLVAYGLLTGSVSGACGYRRTSALSGWTTCPCPPLTRPSLTSVGIPLVNCGRASVDMVLSLVRHPASAPVHHHDLSYQLAVRASSGVVSPTSASALSARPSPAVGTPGLLDTHV